MKNKKETILETEHGNASAVLSVKCKQQFVTLGLAISTLVEKIMILIGKRMTHIFLVCYIHNM